MDSATLSINSLRPEYEAPLLPHFSVLALVWPLTARIIYSCQIGAPATSINLLCSVWKAPLSQAPITRLEAFSPSSQQPSRQWPSAHRHLHPHPRRLLALW